MPRRTSPWLSTKPTTVCSRGPGAHPSCSYWTPKRARHSPASTRPATPTTSSTMRRPSASTSRGATAPLASSIRKTLTTTSSSERSRLRRGRARLCSCPELGGSTSPYPTMAPSKQKSASTRPHVAGSAVLGHPPRVPRGLHGLRVADPAVRGRRSRLLVFRGPCGGTRGSGALRRRWGPALPARGRLLVRDLPQRVFPGGPRAGGDIGDRARRVSHGGEVRSPRIGRPGCYHPWHAARPPRRSYPDTLHGCHLRRAIHLPEQGGALASGRSA